MFPQTRSRFMKSSDGLTTQTTKTSAGFIQLHSVKRLVTAEQLINRQPLSKAKKKDIIKWIEGQQQANQANGKSLCTIVELLKLLADSDGKLFVSEAQSSNSRLKEKLLEWINTRGANRREEHALNRRYRTLPTAAAMTENADALDSVRQLILKGQQLDAVRVASEAGLWTHALIIAGMVGRETFDQISQAFSTAHLDPADPLRTFCSKNTLSGEACSAEFWRDNLTMLINNCPVQSLSERLVAMGQGLFANGLEDEASVCIMLSGTAVDGVDSPSGRLCLVGVDHLRNNLHFFRDLRAFHYTECYEAILRLQNSSFCLPHLQNYKLYYSTLLADCGYTEDAQKYLESISQLVKNFSSNTPYFHSQFYTLLRELDCRLSAALSIRYIILLSV